MYLAVDGKLAGLLAVSDAIKETTPEALQTLRHSGMRVIMATGDGVATGRHAASITGGSIGVMHGKKTYVLQDELGQVREAHSISAGLDYPGVGPEHAHLHATGRASYVAVTDSEAMEALQLLTATEGIIPALESSHAIAHVMQLAPTLRADQIIIVCLSGRGDKDMNTVAKRLGVTL